MVRFLVALCALLPPTVAAPNPTVEDLLDFSGRPVDAVQLVGKAGHRMVPEADGPSAWTFEGGVLTASPAWDSVITPEPYGDFRMHVEFNVNEAANEEREKNGNSGVYVQQRYEVQILDSYGVDADDYQDWDCGSLYRLKRPDVPACAPAGAWQSYDIVFRAARFDGARKVEDARITVFQNDVLIHDDVPLPRKTGAGAREGPEPRAIKLQGHHNQVRFRNVWVQALTLEAMPAVPADDERRATGRSRPRPVQVYILSGQSNMVGIGQVDGPSSRWGEEVVDPVVSVYAGAYDAEADYDARTPIATQALPDYGGVHPTPFPGPFPDGATYLVRGFLELEESGTYEFNPGYAGSTYNVMEVAGVVVYRREPGGPATRTAFRFTAGQRYPFAITFLTDAADGLGWLWRTDLPGTLTTVVKTDGKFPHLVDDEGRWAVRDDVWYKGLVTATADQALTVGCGANAASIGPELQFGHVLGDYHDEPVLLLKTSQGNRSLGWDFLPPGSERFTYEGRTYAGYGDEIPSWTADDPGRKVDWYAGLQYDQCVGAVHDVLDDFAARFPQYADRGYEVAGFVWWQGHKDGNPAHASRYEHNLVNLIRSLRAEFDAPDAPFVIGTIGFGGWELAGPHLTVARAQLAVSGETGRYPEFAGNVLTVETRDFWRDASVSPRNQDFHYNGNADTYLLVGDALGRGMVELLQRR